MNQYTIARATTDDLERIMQLLDYGREIMRSEGNINQWPVGKPARATIVDDIHAGNSYLVMDGDTAVATFAFIPGPDPTYFEIEGEWIDRDAPYYVIHRLASMPQAHGIFATVMNYAKAVAPSLRIDTHEDNSIMQHNILKHGFSYCGIIYLLDGNPRLAYQWLGKK
ncbi:MAG: GNAT family N-acetyltransferase [Muribaculaceae bacterium]|nr:GNAT family N-acetyltransferase [Muribaculaceae bacterium]